MAGATQIDVYNLALSNLGTSKRIQSLTEGTPEAGYCNTFWDRARKIVLEQCYWSFATRAVALGLLLDQLLITDPTQLKYPGWRYIYARPNDSLKVQAVTTIYGIRSQPSLAYWWQLGQQTFPQWGPFRPPWKEALDYTNVNDPAQSVNIVTDQDAAWAIYTTDVSVSLMSETLVDCVAWHLAARIAGPVSASAAAVKNANAECVTSLSRALAQNLNEEQPDDYPQSPSIQARA